MNQLNQLHTSITTKINKGMAAGTDVAYWEGLAADLKTYRARISLQDAHKDLLERIEQAKEEKARVYNRKFHLVMTSLTSRYFVL